jgi:NADH dehydrogenase FAD-containing subunit
MSIVDAAHDPARSRVLIAGGGVAGLEMLLALRALAFDLLDITIIAPSSSSSTCR